MNTHARYALEKLGHAIYYLAVGGGDVRERLKTVYAEIHPISEDAFPPNLRKDWKWILTQLTRFGPVRRSDGTVRTGAVDNTLSRIKNSTGAKIAERIVALELELRNQLHDG